MIVDGLPIPEVLVEAIASGRWPRTAEEESLQNSNPLGNAERIRRFARIYLYRPPFVTVASILRGKDHFYQSCGAIDQLIPEAAIQIGDLGTGADSPILLDYSENAHEPRVIYLYWSNDGSPNEWVELTPNAVTFLEFVGL